MMKVNLRKRLAGFMGLGDTISLRTQRNATHEFNSGFTLVELMVVIGIIGILVSVILTQIVPYVIRGSDTAIKADLNSIQSQSSIEFLNLGRRYSKTGVAINSGDCATVSTVDTMFANPQIQASLAHMKEQNGNIVMNCNLNAAGSAWAIAVTLPSGKIWCADSTGVSKGTQGITTTPYIGQYAGSSSYAINSAGPQYSCS